MLNDIKEHKTNTSIKSSTGDIKVRGALEIKTVQKNISGSQKGRGDIENKIDSLNNSKDKNNDIANETLNSQKAVVGGSGLSNYEVDKNIASVPIRKYYNKQVVPAKQSFAKTKSDIKSQNTQAKNNIKSAKKQYKQSINNIKAEKKNNKKFDSATNIKIEKNKYKSKVLSEKITIKNNKKKLGVIKKEFKKKLFNVKKLKFLAVGAATVVSLCVVISLVGLLVSPMGVLFTTDGENSYSVESVIKIINDEFRRELEDIKSENEYDAVSISNQGCLYTLSNWQNVLAVWSVYSYSSDFVFVIDDNSLNKIRDIAFDMITISSETKESTVVLPSISDSQTQESKVKTLEITVDYLTIDEMAKLYNFSESQKEDLNELMSSEDYLDLFRSATNSAVGGEVVGSLNFVYPVKNVNITATYPSYSDGSYHSGVDFAVPKGTEIYAVSDGVVASVRKLNYSYGYHILIDHGNGVSTLYAHNSELLVNEGDVVKQGDVIAYSGSTGNSTGPHCHFEVRINGNCVDPIPYFYNVN